MFAFSFRTASKSVIDGDRVSLRHPDIHDYQSWAALRAESADFLQPWEPRWPRDDLAPIAYRGRLRRYGAEIKAGTGLPFFIVRQSDSALLGGITLGHIKRGVSQSGQIGYWIGKPHAGQGYMAEAVELLCQLAFSRYGLHRLEAACIPTNERSIKLLKTAGFEPEGRLRSYLKINGAWQDHILFSRINPLHQKLTPLATQSDGTPNA